MKAGSSIRQSSGLQIRRLQVRFLSRLPTRVVGCKTGHACTPPGEMAEWSIALVLKTRGLTARGFESLSLLHLPSVSRTWGGRIVGLVRRFAKPLGEQSPREFESLPPRQLTPCSHEHGVCVSPAPHTRRPPCMGAMLATRTGGRGYGAIRG